VPGKKLTTRAAAVPRPPAASRTMPRWLPKGITLFWVIGLLVLASVRFLGLVQDIITLVVIALFASFAIEPAVNWLADRGWRRGLSTGLILLALFLGGLGLVGSMIPLIIDQLQDLVRRLPEWLDQISTYSERWFGVEVSKGAILSDISSYQDALKQVAANVAHNILGIAGALLGAIFQLLTIALFTFYFVAEGPKIRRGLCSMLPRERQVEVLRVVDIAIEKTGGYLYSRLLMAAISGVTTFVVLLVLGVPFAVPLAVWQGLLSQFIPVVGTYIAMALPLLIAGLEGGGADALILVIFFALYQQVENYVLTPKISARTMSLHPVVTIISAIVGARLGGAIGAFLALPAAAIIQATASTYIRRHEVVEDELTEIEEHPPEE